MINTKILITAFKPFNKEDINNSLLILNNLNIDSDKLILDVVYNDDGLKVISKIKNNNYDYIFLLGEARSRNYISLEEIALNIEDSIVADNKGVIRNNNPIIINHDLAYKTNIDLIKIINELDDKEIRVSYHAGTFICNEVYYYCLDYIYNNNLNTKCVFIHIPNLINKDLSQYVKKVENIIKSIIDI